MGHIVMSCISYASCESLEVINGRSSKTLLCPSWRNVRHSCSIECVKLVEHGGFEVGVNARRRRSRESKFKSEGDES
jgi:hypothetical protein